MGGLSVWVSVCGFSVRVSVYGFCVRVSMCGFQFVGVRKFIFQLQPKITINCHLCKHAISQFLANNIKKKGQFIINAGKGLSI